MVQTIPFKAPTHTVDRDGMLLGGETIPFSRRILLIPTRARRSGGVIWFGEGSPKEGDRIIASARTILLFHTFSVSPSKQPQIMEYVPSPKVFDV